MNSRTNNLKKTLAIIMTIAAVWILGGCGGGGGGSNATSPRQGYGQMSANIDFTGRPTARMAAAPATGVIDIIISVTGFNPDGITAFATVTTQISIDISAGSSSATVHLEVPIGINHLITAIATYPDGATATVKYIIPEIREGVTTQAVANDRTTVIADAVIAIAERDGVNLSQIPQADITSVSNAVDAFHNAGYSYDNIKVQDVLVYESSGDALQSIIISPAAATVIVGSATQFTATPNNSFGIAATATVVWSVTGGVGTIDSTGLFTASAAGSGSVIATAGTISGSASVTVTAAQTCGNAAIETGETCDDGVNNGKPTFCNASCNGTTSATCGNGTVESGEACDTAGESATCNADCTAVACGDGVTNTTAGETCDDNNATTETCSYGQTSCSVCNSTCHSVAGTASFCGDSITSAAAGETCDDGNAITETCAFGQTSCTVCNSSCHSAAGTPSYCGDSIISAAAGETCDDGNAVTESCAYGQTSCSVCNSSCATAAGATAYCGDSFTNAANGETCDDGNAITESCPIGQNSCSVCNASCQSVAGADITAPVVTSTVPSNSAISVSANAAVTTTFSEAMAAATLNTTTFTLTQGASPVPAVVTYTGLNATLTPSGNLSYNTLYTVTITSGAADLAGNSLDSAYTWTFTTGSAPDTTPPTVTLVLPPDASTGVCVNKKIDAAFSEAMNPSVYTTFTIMQGATPVPGNVVYSGATATFTPTGNLTPGLPYTATISTAAMDLAGNPLSTSKVWTFTAGSTTCATPVPLGSAASFVGFGGGAGMTNGGLLTVVGGDIGTTGISNTVTGFHDSVGDIYTTTGSNDGSVTGRVYTAAPPPGGAGVGGNAGTFVIASNAAADALTAYNNMSPTGLPGGVDPGAGQLGGLTLAPGIYTAAGSTFLLTGADLTLDGQSDPDSVWVFQAATTLTVGSAGLPRSIILTNGAQAKNVFWYVGTTARIEDLCDMLGTIIANSGVTISTAGQAQTTSLLGRALSLNAATTMVNTIITMPAP